MTDSKHNPAKALSRLGRWETSLPVGIQILWFNVTRPEGSSILANNHSHPFYEVHFLLSGEVCYECSGVPITIHENEALFVPPLSPHRYCQGDMPFEMAYLAFTLKPDAASVMPFPTQTQVFFFSEDVVKNVRAIMKRTETDDIFTPVFIGNRILEIIHSFCKSLDMTLPPMPAAKEDPRLTAAKEYIDKNKHCRIGCEDVATACGISRKQLNRIFKKHTGKTLNDYLLEVQLMYAEKLVLQGEHNIKQIGYLLGFKNEGGFGVYFKRYFGLPPKLYREQFHKKRTNFLD